MLRVPLLAVFLGHQEDHVPVSRILIVEDDTLVGMGLRAQLEKLGHEVVGQASTAAEAKELYRELRPDITQGETLFCHLRRRSTPWVFRCGDTLGSPAACTVQALVKRDRADVFRIVWTNESTSCNA